MSWAVKWKKLAGNDDLGCTLTVERDERVVVVV